MIIAIPIEDGKLCSHFGHCSIFALFQIDGDNKNHVTRRDVNAPPHEPGLLPAWMAELGVNLVICGGMGHKALELFAQKNIKVITGAPIDTPESIIAAHLQMTLKTDSNSCDH